ncbi:MAG: histidine--tRNA ligase [Clostridiaceae bacterium]|jgi:histidyl-tRNA synthetase|nr:histidine--tRNA ligase [Bacillota bacterium]NLN51428.1 histidine--tRNA ligase [Clostridiaceae bacterium]
MDLKAPRGTRDILPVETPAWQYVEQSFSSVCDRFSFQEIRVPTFEQTELFQRGVGDTTDIVQKEMYTFEDKGGRSMTLRPEGTAGVVRAYLENGLSSEPSPQKLYYILNSFRYEKMGKGRYREFNQMGCELFGSEEPTADAEIISLLFLFFRELGLKEINLKINSIGCPKCKPAYLDQLREYLRPQIHELCENCQDRFERNPMRILDCKEDAENEIVKNAPLQLEHLCSECEEHFASLCAELDNLGFQYEIDGHIVRGLDYYSRTVFEFISNNVGTQGTICGGGRYDGLIEELGGLPTPAVGFALGVERLLMELNSQNIVLPSVKGPDIYIVSFPDTINQAAKICFELRNNKIKAENNLNARSFRAQMKYADRIQAKYLVVLGEDELKTEKVSLKRMSDGEEIELDLADLAEYIKNN